jgi:hypothetical protein
MCQLAKSALEIALQQLGDHEKPKGSNAGKEVEEFLSAVGLKGGYAWCMAYVYFCVNKASIDLKITNPLLKTAGVLKQWNERPDLRVGEPQAGDVFIMDFGKGKGHTGFVVKADKTYIYTIEGNTNDDGSREGYEVALMKRKKSTIKGYLRVCQVK